MAYPIQSMADGRVRMSDGTIQEAPNTFSSVNPVSNINPYTLPELYPTAFPKVSGFSSQQETSPVAPQPQQEMQSAPVEQEASQPQQEQPDLIHDVSFAILSGMKPNEIPKYYPELKDADTSLFSDMYSSIQSGMPTSEAPKLYPELFPQDFSLQAEQPQEEK